MTLDTKAGASDESAASRPQLSRREPFARQVAITLRDMIVRGEMPPGGRIVERVLCQRISVSRTPLREALKLLEVEGLVEIAQHRGARVAPFTAAEARDLFEVIAGLEGLSAELAVGRIPPDELAELEAAHAAMLERYARRDKDGYFDLNTAIHDAIVRASENRVMIATHAGLTLRARRGRYMAILDPARWRDSVEEHEAVMAAFRARDAEGAGRIWRAHLMRTGETVIKVISQASADQAQIVA